ncbi:MAG: InlB B-repeat-containing protein [Blautia sp.]|nr:InlB B-repeat-containing protein [Blautia sp.]
MKRRILSWMLTAGMLFAVCGLAACGGADKEEGTQESTQTAESTEETESREEAAGPHTVTFYDSDGTTVLNTVEVEDGAAAEAYAPEKEGYTFVGWFATPQMSHRFDFASAITEDISLFAGFVSYVEDTRSFAIVGSGKSPALLESNWGAVIGEAQTMTKEDTEGANVYTITLDLEAGDEFQFAMDSSWGAQRGYGYLTTIEQDGVEYFKNSGGLGDTGVKKANIKVAVSGNYTLTLTTYPGEDTYDTEDPYYTEDGKENFNYNAFDTITWTYNGESAGGGAEYQTDYYIKGAVITGWEDVYTDETRFTETDGIYTLTIALEEGDEFLFTTLLTAGDSESVGNEYVRYTNIAESDSDSLACVSGSENANMIAVKAGTYTFTYDPSTKILTVACE